MCRWVAVSSPLHLCDVEMSLACLTNLQRAGVRQWNSAFVTGLGLFIVKFSLYENQSDGWFAQKTGRELIKNKTIDSELDLFDVAFANNDSWGSTPGCQKNASNWLGLCDIARTYLSGCSWSPEKLNVAVEVLQHHVFFCGSISFSQGKVANVDDDDDDDFRFIPNFNSGRVKRKQKPNDPTCE